MHPTITVLFVCTGNTCRSPLAEAIARKLAAVRGLRGLRFASAGTNASPGAAAADAAVLVGVERGFDLSRHRARMLTRELIPPGTLVLVMSHAHLDAVSRIAPDADAHLLSDFASRGVTQRGVADPFGGALDDYRTAADEIEAMISDALERLASESRRRRQ